MSFDDDSETKAPKKRERMGCMRLFFVPFLLAGLAVFWAITLNPLWHWMVSASWERTPCTILESELEKVPGDESTMYRVKVTYRYEFGGEVYTGRRFNFDTGTSSARDWKARAVAALPADAKAECFVNPRNPQEAVIERAPSVEIWFGLFGLPFIAVGCMAFMSTQESRLAKARQKSGRTSARQRAAGAVEEADEEKHAAKPGWRLLKPTAPRGQHALIITGAAIFWNAITWTFLLGSRHSNGGIEWGPTLFLSLFALVGLLLAGAAIHRILSLFNPRLRVSVERGMLRLGGTRGLEWEFLGATGRIRSLTVTLEGQEEATYTRGTTTTTDRRVFLKEELFTDHDPLSLARGATEIRAPADTMHSFAAGHNAVAWVVRIRGEIPMFPDVNDEFPVNLAPLDGAQHSTSARAPAEDGAPRNARGVLSNIRLGLRENRTAFAPGELIAGAVDWACQSAPKSAEIRLGWTTIGKGTTDFEVVERLIFQQVKATDLRTFEFTAPAEPYSFSGKLVSLVWSVELVMQPGDLRQRREIVIAPGGHEVLLPGVTAS